MLSPVKDWQENENYKSRDIVFNHYRKSVDNKVKSLCKKFGIKDTSIQADLKQDGYLLLLEVISKYNFGKSPLSMYLENYVSRGLEKIISSNYVESEDSVDCLLTISEDVDDENDGYSKCLLSFLKNISDGGLTVDNDIDKYALTEALDIALDTLTPRERKVLELRFGLLDGSPQTLAEIGVYFNVNSEKIRKIDTKALLKLRHPSNARNLKMYLEY